MNKPTRDWYISCRGSEGYCVFQSGPISKELHSLSPVADCTKLPFEMSKENAVFIATAWNACRAINPDNPLTVAERLPELVGALKNLIRSGKVYGSHNMGPALDEAHAVLAKLEGKS